MSEETSTGEGTIRTPSPSPTRPETIYSSTPRVVRSDGGTADITKLRDIIAKEMDPEFITCTLDHYFEAYLHPPADEDVELCITHLKNVGLLERLGEQDTNLAFTVFREHDNPETTFFQPLEEICEALVESFPGNNDRPHFKCCPNKCITSLIYGSNNKIDGCLRFEEGDTINAWDIAVAFEFKTIDSVEKFRDNAVKVVSANVQIMNEDPRRMFTFGVTIEHHTVRLFYHCRSHSAVSKPFNLAEDPKTFIKVLLSFLRADRHQLGYDPLITRIPDGSHIYQVSDANDIPRFYHTVKLIHERRLNIITGRAPRIWQVIQVASSTDTKAIPGSERAVLKHFWLHHTDNTEVTLQQEIWQDLMHGWKSMESSSKAEITKLYPDFGEIISQETFKKYFLTIEANVRGEETHCIPPVYRQEAFLWPSSSPPPSTTMAHPHRTPHLSYAMSYARSVLGSPPTDKRDFDCKQRHFVVFKEVCTEFGDIRVLGDAIQILRDSLLGLLFLYCAGWVHRDLSMQNMMAHRISEDAPWQAKISDLEYAKKFGSCQGSKDPKTGTPFFTPVDIMRGDWPQELFKNRSGLEPTRAGEPPRQLQILSFFASYRHDMESLWWIMVFLVLVGLPTPGSLKLANAIFCKVINLKSRAKFFNVSIGKKLEDVLVPAVSFFAGFLEDIRSTLAELDMDLATQGSLLEQSKYLVLYKEFHRMFERIDRQDGWQHLWLYPNHDDRDSVATTPLPLPLPPQRPVKRRRDSDEYSPSDSSSFRESTPPTRDLTSHTTGEPSSSSGQTRRKRTRRQTAVERAESPS